MVNVALVDDSRGVIAPLVRGLLSQHWTLEALPSNGRLKMNRQAIVLRLSNSERRFRLHVYKVTGTGRGRTNERRIEITTTYVGGSHKPVPGFDDIVLGYDPDTNVYVAFDSDRLRRGGPTHNASSFFDEAGLRVTSTDGMLVMPRASELYGVEYHAFFQPSRSAEYLLNHSQIHLGQYLGAAGGAGQRRPRRIGAPSVGAELATGDCVSLRGPETKAPPVAPRKGVVEQLETGLGPRTQSRVVSPEQLQASLKRAAENGALGEKFVFDLEVARLMRAGKRSLASRVEWTSHRNAAAGYDIASYNEDGSARLVEVKSTQGSSNEFPMSRGEWRKAQAARGTYVIARVTNVRKNPSVTWLEDPVGLEALGKLNLVPDSYRVKVVAYP